MLALLVCGRMAPVGGKARALREGYGGVACVVTRCYDVHDRTMGSFAVLYNRDGAAMVLQVMAMTHMSL